MTYLSVAQPRVIRGHLSATQMRMAIIASRFNHVFVEKLVEGALDALVQHGAEAEKQSVVWVPGAFELPVFAQKVAKSGKFDAVICLGAVIRGESEHYDYVCQGAASGIASVAVNTGVPVMFGVLTVESMEQALARSGSKVGNLGWSSAVAAVESVNVLKNIEQL